jgi:transcriptional regulator with XRE-family HTH domain
VKADLLEKFGHRVRELREKQRLSQEGFAEQVGLDRTYISGIERGVRNPTLSTIQRLAEGFGIPIEKLMKGF